MPKIEHIGIEFFGKDAMGVVFSKLETLQLIHMPEWKKWSSFSDELGMQFPSLLELTISKCSKLSTVPPFSLPALHILKLEECKVIVLERLCDLGSLNSLKVESVAGLPYLPRELVRSMTNIEILEFRDCNELVSVWPNGEVIQHPSTLRHLVVARCALFVSLGDDHQQAPQNLEILELIRCESLTLLPNDLRNLRGLTIRCCSGITNFPEHAIPPTLRRLDIEECIGLESIPSDISTLERLSIKNCPSLRNWSGNFPSGIRDLSIVGCKELEAIPAETFPANIRVSLESLCTDGWQKWSSLLRHVYSFSRLTKLELRNCDGLDSFLDQGLPPNLRELSVGCCSNLRSLPTQIQNTPSIQSIIVSECRKLESFPGFEFPRNLSELHVWNCGELKPLSEWGLHRLTSLRKLTIHGGFEELQLLAETNHGHLFPSSLTELLVSGFRKLRSVPGVLDNLTSLRHLFVSNCESLGDLPGENVLEKLWRLLISDCPILKQRCLKDKGDYWPRIAGIPAARIDFHNPEWEDIP